MKATAHSIRLAPKKANIIALMVRGMTVPDAVEALRKTHKKGARIVEKLLRSAIANAGHNDKQDPQTMIIKTIVVNQGTAYRRGMPKARGQMRPYRKFLCHIDLMLGYPEDKTKKTKKTDKTEKKDEKDASPKAKSAVKDTSKTRKTSTSSESSISSKS